MIIEWLKFQVAAEHRETLIEKDEAVWTPALAGYAGFLGKDIWIDPKKPNEVVFVIRWANRQVWKDVPEEALAKTEQEFARRMGAIVYTLTEAGEYQVRRFARANPPE
jgi:uncharacterized protein (TIGR03792 family)